MWVTEHLARFLGGRRKGTPHNPGSRWATLRRYRWRHMKSGLLRGRVLPVLNRSGGQIRELASVDLDLAVARGAAYYGLARHGRGIRIRLQFVYTCASKLSPASVPGIPAPMKALCVAPFGMEEGSNTTRQQGVRSGGVGGFSPARLHCPQARAEMIEKLAG